MHLTPERWWDVVRIYERVVDQDPPAREAMLADACGGDEALQREVESLLGHDQAPVLVDRSIWAKCSDNRATAVDPRHARPRPKAWPVGDCAAGDGERREAAAFSGFNLVSKVRTTDLRLCHRTGPW